MSGSPLKRLKKIHQLPACSGTIAGDRKCMSFDIFENLLCERHGGTGRRLRYAILTAHERSLNMLALCNALPLISDPEFRAYIERSIDRIERDIGKGSDD